MCITELEMGHKDTGRRMFSVKGTYPVMVYCYPP